MFIVHRDEEKEGDVDLKLLMIRTLIREDCCDGNDLDLDQTMMEIMRLKIMMRIT